MLEGRQLSDTTPLTRLIPQRGLSVSNSVQYPARRQVERGIQDRGGEGGAQRGGRGGAEARAGRAATGHHAGARAQPKYLQLLRLYYRMGLAGRCRFCGDTQPLREVAQLSPPSTALFICLGDAHNDAGFQVHVVFHSPVTVQSRYSPVPISSPC